MNPLSDENEEASAPCMLHAALVRGELTLWVERLVDPDEVASPKGRLSMKAPREHPLEPDEEELLALFGEVLGAQVHEYRLIDAYVWLPTFGNMPAGARRDPRKGSHTPRLMPWRVIGLSLMSDEAQALLERARGRDLLPGGVHVSPELKLLTRMIDLLGALLAMQHVVPSLEARGDALRPRWEVADEQLIPAELARIAQRAPAILCSLREEIEPAPPTDRRRVELDAFLRAMLDAEMSRLAQAQPRPSQLRARHDERIHERWVRAFYEAGLSVDAGKGERLLKEVSSWRRPFELATRTPLRLVLSLEEPHEDEETIEEEAASLRWPLRLLLQDLSDPSLLVDASRLQSLPLGKRERAVAREYLMTHIGRASRMSPVIRELLADHESLEGLEFETEQAWRFLHEDVPALRRADIRLRLPTWWTGRGAKKKLRARARAMSDEEIVSSGMGLDAIVRFEWRVALGDRELDEAQLRRLAALKAPLLKIGGEWVEVDAEDIERALEMLSRGEIEARARELVEASLGAGRGALESELELDGIEASGDLGELLAGLTEATFAELEEPEGFEGTLRPYQRRGYSWMHFLTRWGFGACLADDMGLGKTIQTLALLQRLWRERGPAPSLLVCPTSVVNNWRREAQKFTPELPVAIYHGSDRDELVEDFDALALVITSYGILHRDREILEARRWRGAILDEAQQIKNAQTYRARAARALEADFALALTGTPVENRVGDLWSIMEFINPGLLEERKRFRSRFELPIQLEGDEEAARRLRQRVGPFILRRLKTDPDVISDLPDKIEEKVYCELTTEQASLYQAELDHLDAELANAGPQRRRGVILGALTRLKQICNHPHQRLKDGTTLEGRSGKLMALEERVEAILDADDACLIFSQYREMGKLIVEHLEGVFGREVLFLHGGTTRNARDEMVERFDEPTGPPLFVLSLHAGGTGLNLVRANHVIHYDRWWNPAVESQATDRSFRIGQTRNVQVHTFVCQGTLEERIDEMLERKQQIADQVVGAGEAWLTELDDQALREALALRR